MAVTGRISTIFGGITKVKVNYITINQNVTDPASMISGDINGEVIQWIRKNSHRYLGKYTASGEMTVCQLNDSNSTQYSDGSPAVLTGGQGDVFMKLPSFFYHAEETSSDVWEIGFSIEKISNSWKEWEGIDLIGVYESYITGSKAYSRSGVASTGNISQTTYKTYARNRGSGYTLVKMKHHNIMAFLFYAMYGNTNSQSIIGVGTSSYTKNTGQTDALGMSDTNASTNGNTMSINFWGLENWWGNKYEYVDNVLVNVGASNGIWTITEDDGTERNAQGVVTGANTYIRKIVIGSFMDLIIKTTTAASSNTGYCDAQYVQPTLNRVFLRSSKNNGVDGGIAFARVEDDSTVSAPDFSSRIVFRGKIIESTDVTSFKAITITN